jgi:hypothetical protein
MNPSARVLLLLLPGQGFGPTKQVVHCRAVLPLQDVPEVLAVGAPEEIGLGRKQNRVHVLDIKTPTLRALCSGGHAAHLRKLW